MLQVQIEFHPHKGQQRVLESRARFRVCAAGRRWGKTVFGIYLVMSQAIENPGSFIWWVSPVYAQAMIPYRRILSTAREIIADHNKDEKRIEFINSSVIEFKSADKPDNLRGEGLDLLIIDEAAYIDDEAWYACLRPTLSDRCGKAVMISTPAGKNWFYHVFMLGFTDPEYASFRSPTEENPIIPRSEIEEARRNLPDYVFRQEYLAEFIDSSSAVFPSYGQCISTSISPEPKPGMKYLAGWDIGKRQSYSVLTIMDRTGRVVKIQKITGDYSAQVEQVVQLVKQYNNARLCVDATGLGDPIVDVLKRYSINVYPLRLTSDSKASIINALSISFSNQSITIPPDPELLRELDNFTVDYTRHGKLKLGARKGYHDDYVISLALANWLLHSRKEIGVLWI